MKLTVFTRQGTKKSEKNLLRIKGEIPAVLYIPGEPSETIYVSGKEFHAHLRNIPKGHLSNTVFTLEKNGKTFSALVKDIQYDPTTYDVIHLDFQKLQDDVRVNVKIPIDCANAADCPGLKLGGMIRQVIRKLPIRCFPKDIPSSFEVDVSSMNVGDVKKLSDLKVNPKIHTLMPMSEVVVVIAKGVKG